MLVKLGHRRTLIVPKELCADLDENTVFEAIRRDDGVIEFHPTGVADPEQAWFWTEQWQRMEQEADEDYAAGRFKRFDDAESFLADLEAHTGEDATPTAE